MCGRYALKDELNSMIEEFVAAGGDFRDWRPSYNIAPTNSAPIVREWTDTDSGETSRVIELAKWGIRPAWAKPGGPAPINARLETVATNGLFRASFTSQRCIVPMSPGYYEWEAREDGKQPYLIQGDGSLAAAGLYASKQDEAGQWKRTYTIITREARDASGEIHDRMPTFLSGPDERDQWLSAESLTTKDKVEAQGRNDEMLAMLDRSSLQVAKTIQTYPVSRAVNNVKTADRYDPALIEPLQETS